MKKLIIIAGVLTFAFGAMAFVVKTKHSSDVKESVSGGQNKTGFTEMKTSQF